MFSNFPWAQCPKKDSGLYITLMQVQYICLVHDGIIGGFYDRMIL